MTAHTAAALWLLRERELSACRAEMPALIRAYNAATGVPNTDTGGFHAMITAASRRAAHAWPEPEAICPSRAGSMSCSRASTAAPTGRSPTGRGRGCSRSRARHGWVEPDLRALEF